MRTKLLRTMIVITALILGGCSSLFPTALPDSGSQGPEAGDGGSLTETGGEDPAATSSEPQPATEETSATIAAPQEAADVPTSEPTAETDNGDSPTETLTIKAELSATDPGSVSLASGRVQLIEFFAFW